MWPFSHHHGHHHHHHHATAVVSHHFLFHKHFRIMYKVMHANAILSENVFMLSKMTSSFKVATPQYIAPAPVYQPPVYQPPMVYEQPPVVYVDSHVSTRILSKFTMKNTFAPNRSLRITIPESSPSYFQHHHGHHHHHHGHHFGHHGHHGHHY